MPIYEYHCRDCGADFEKLVRGSSEPDIVCPACGSSRAERKLSTFAAPSSRPAGGCAPGGG